MKRRTFLKNTSLASTMLLVPQFVKAFEHLPPAGTFKRLVIIQLSGGNDGLNTVIPYRNDLYYQKRPRIALPKSAVLRLTDDTGLHPELTGLKALYDQGFVSILNGVGYPNPNRSHFRSMDIWQTASGSDEYLQTGWIGRILDHQNGHPHDAIETDDQLSLTLKGEKHNGIAAKDPKILYRMAADPFFKKTLSYQKDAHLNEHNLGYLYRTLIDTESSANYIFQTTKTYKNTQSYPNNPLAKQLKTVAQYINSGLDTKIFYTSLGGFDTHVAQNNRQKRLMKIYSESILPFVKELRENNTFKDTLIMTFSEFGRRVSENAAGGTDHGTANNVFIIGESLKKQGIYNDLPRLDNLDSNGDLIHTIDFRRIYATILKNWLQIDQMKILNGKHFSTLKFI